MLIVWGNSQHLDQGRDSAVRGLTVDLSYAVGRSETSTNLFFSRQIFSCFGHHFLLLGFSYVS